MAEEQPTKMVEDTCLLAAYLAFGVDNGHSATCAFGLRHSGDMGVTKWHKLATQENDTALSLNMTTVTAVTKSSFNRFKMDTKADAVAEGTPEQGVKQSQVSGIPSPWACGFGLPF